MLCDTNGGMLPPWIGEIVTAASEIGVPLGVHTHNDTGCAVANTLAAVDAGVMHVQGTVNGYGERTGNAELLSVVANLELKYGWPLLPAGSLREATRLAHAIAEVTNVPPSARQPYVGLSSFAHKRGCMPARSKWIPTSTSTSTRHRPATTCGCLSPIWRVGRTSRSRVRNWIRPLRPRARGSDHRPVKDAEAAGYTYEAADASFELLLRRELGQLPEYFTVHSWRVFTQSTHANRPIPSAPYGDRQGQSQRVVGRATVDQRSRSRRTQCPASAYPAVESSS